MTNQEFAKLRLVKNLQHKNFELRCKLATIKAALQRHLSGIEEAEKVKYTEQYALFSMDERGKYHFQKIIDTSVEDETDDDICGESAIIVRLPDHATLKDFDGF